MSKTAIITSNMGSMVIEKRLKQIFLLFDKIYTQTFPLQNCRNSITKFLKKDSKAGIQIENNLRDIDYLEEKGILATIDVNHNDLEDDPTHKEYFSYQLKIISEELKQSNEYNLEKFKTALFSI